MTWKIFWWGVCIFCALLAAYLYSLFEGYFFIYWWWDIPMHIVGGMLAGFIGAWFFSVRGYRPTIVAALSGVIVLGIGVEIAEYVAGFTYSPWMSYPVDTVKDLINDVLGGFLAAYIISRL